MTSLPQNIIPMKDYRDAREQTVVPEMRDDLCIQCGQPTDAHFSVNGRKQDCAFALKYAAVQTSNPQRWNDPHAALTCAIRRAMVLECGPALAEFLKTFTNDEQLAMASAIGRRVHAELCK